MTMRLKSWFFFLLVGLSFQSYSQQSVTGIWRGYFISSDGYYYKLEFQVKQNASYSVSGVSYSWQDDIRFYGKATMTGNYMDDSQIFRIREIKTVEVKTMGGGTCIMNYDLQYSRSGKEEFLEGTYLGKTEVKDGPIHTSGVNAVPVKSFFERWRPLIFISSRHCGPLQKNWNQTKVPLHL